MKRLMLLAAAMVALAVPVAASARTSHAAISSRSMATSKSIVALAASDPQLSTLVKLVKEAGLVKALSGSTKLTVFAPTNAAFAAVPKATLSKLAHDKALLIKVLEYHVVAGVLPAAKVLKLHSAKTLEGASIHFSVRHGHAYVNNAEIIKVNLMASNGVVHIINKVLIP